ncbi:MAG: FAD-binding protein [Thermoguttaceae bacterium]|nr:FAD-binding protein [Thermoguttaceae bacterium]MDW8078676.1 FAD-binding protein [Thermoguttaceae bacterium]
MVYSATERTRVQDDLRGLVAGDVRTHPLFCSLYASDGSILWQEPLAVVRPSRVEDVIACIRYAQERKIPLIPRGAGSGTAGGAIGQGIILDFSRYFRRVVTTPGGNIQAAAGATIERINQGLRPLGRHLPWKTSGGWTSTIGGVVARAALPWAYLRYGGIEDYIVSLQIVLADGSLVDLPNRCTSPSEGSYQGKNHTDWWGRLTKTLEKNQRAIFQEQSTPQRSWCGLRLRASLASSGLVDSHAVEAHGQPSEGIRSPSTNKFLFFSGEAPCSALPGSTDTSMHPIKDAAVDDTAHPSTTADQSKSSLPLNAAQLFIGSEGILGLITQVEIAPPPIPPAQGSAVFFFESLDEALQAAGAAVVVEPAGTALLDHRHLSLARESEPRLAAVIPREAQFALFAELEAETTRSLRQKIDELRAAVQSVAKSLGPGVAAAEPWDRQLVDRLAEPVPAALYRSRSGGRPVAFLDTLAVPPNQLESFLSALFGCLRRAELTAATYCHPLDGRVFIRPIVDLSDRDQRAKLLCLAEEVYHAVLDHHGSIVAGGGWGLVRTSYVDWQFPQLGRVFAEIKAIFDPECVLNPGKLVGGLPRENFRELLQAGLILRGQAGEHRGEKDPCTDRRKRSRARREPSAQATLAEAEAKALKPLATTCFACGGCRHQWQPGRMCPVFRFLPAEEASPRAKANLLLGLLSQENPARQMASAQLREIADLCVHCHMCSAECPAGVSVPELVLELKGHHAASAGLLFSDWVMARLDLFAGWALKAPRVANWALQTRWVRWLLEKLLGLAQGRYIPPVASRSFVHLATRNRWSIPTRHRGPAVAYFCDLFVNYFAPQLGQLFAKVLEHNGVAFFVPEKQHQAGVPAIASGAVDIARRLIRRNSRVLAQAVRLGYQVVATEPAAALALKKEYPLLDSSADTQLVAESTTEACSYLWMLHQEGRLQLDFRPVPLTVGYHQPCRSRALGVGRPAENLLRLIPGLQLLPIPDACSGMAGTFGLKATNYRASLRGGFPLVATLRQPQFQAVVTECSACKIQLEQGTGKPALHPIELLACAYGFIPLESLLRPPGHFPIRQAD